jgi:hypothetical protein
MDDARTAAFADLVAGVLAVRTDHASARFDLELARAEAAGTIDAETARTLRWWQRESVRAVADHVSRVLPEVLVEVEGAEADAAEQIAESADAWATATALAAIPGTGETVSAPPAPSAPVSAPAPAPGAGPGTDPRPGAPSGPPIATVTPLTTAPSAPTSVPPQAPGTPSGPFRPVPPEPADPSARAGSGPTGRSGVATTATSPDRGASGSGAPSRRTLVAGLTVLGDERGPDRP